MNTIPIINIPTWELAKAFIVFGLLIYIVFAFILVRQARLMRETFKIEFGKVVTALVIGHLMFAVGVLFLALIIL